MTAYPKFRKWNTGIRFRNREWLFPVLPIIKKKKKNECRPTLDFFDMWPKTHIFIFGLIEIIGKWWRSRQILSLCCTESEWFFELFQCMEKIQVFPQSKQNRVKSRQTLLIYFYFYRCYIWQLQGSDFDSACPKIEIKTLGGGTKN